MRELPGYDGLLATRPPDRCGQSWQERSQTYTKLWYTASVVQRRGPAELELLGAEPNPVRRIRQ